MTFPLGSMEQPCVYDPAVNVLTGGRKKIITLHTVHPPPSIWSPVFSLGRVNPEVSVQAARREALWVVKPGQGFLPHSAETAAPRM